MNISNLSVFGCSNVVSCIISPPHNNNYYYMSRHTVGKWKLSPKRWLLPSNSRSLKVKMISKSSRAGVKQKKLYLPSGSLAAAAPKPPGTRSGVSCRHTENARSPLTTAVSEWKESLSWVPAQDTGSAEEQVPRSFKTAAERDPEDDYNFFSFLPHPCPILRYFFLADIPL